MQGFRNWDKCNRLEFVPLRLVVLWANGRRWKHKGGQSQGGERPCARQQAPTHRSAAGRAFRIRVCANRCEGVKVRLSTWQTANSSSTRHSRAIPPRTQARRDRPWRGTSAANLRFFLLLRTGLGCCCTLIAVMDETGGTTPSATPSAPRAPPRFLSCSQSGATH